MCDVEDRVVRPAHIFRMGVPAQDFLVKLRCGVRVTGR